MPVEEKDDAAIAIAGAEQHTPPPDRPSGQDTMAFLSSDEPSSSPPANHLRETFAAQRKVAVLRSAEFRKGREDDWRQLDEMVTRAEKKGIGALSAQDAQTLPLLYRATLSSLSVARTIALDRNLLRYLESLALRAYLVVYGPRTGIFSNLKYFLSQGFPSAVRSIRWHLLVAFLVFMTSGLAGTILVMGDESYYSSFISDRMAQGRTPSSTAVELREVLFVPWYSFVETFIHFANYLFNHNTIVGIFCFSLGFAAGVPTLFLLAYNGMILGAMLALHINRGLGMDFLGWVSIHGVTEILAILLCGAAGLVIAEKILFPGPQGRMESLATRGREAAGVAAGAILMFFIAGIIEGGFRQLIAWTPGRFAFAAVTGLIWVRYFLSGRKVSTQGETLS